MKRKNKVIGPVVCLTLLAVLLGGCNGIQEGKVLFEQKEQGQEAEYDIEELVWQNRPETSVLAETAGGQEKNYAYGCLQDTQKQLYLEILYALQRFQQDMPVSSLQEEELAYVFQCVMNDHPELFYVAGYTFTKYTVGGEVTQITLSGTYTMEQKEAEQKRAEIEKKADEWLAALPKDADEYEKVKYIYEYLILHTEYNIQAQDNQNICSVFLYGESVCQGYAKAMQYLLDKAGVSSTLVSGYVENGDGHAWNLVMVNGAYYYVDPTWGDAYYKLDQNYEEPAEHLPDINYDYLCVTTDQLTATHTVDNIVPVPRCVQTEDNYYVREGAYFTDCDETKLEQLFEHAYAQEKDSVTMKCQDSAVYTQLKRILLEEQQVFQYLEGADGRVAYTDNDAQMTISFWL